MRTDASQDSGTGIASATEETPVDTGSGCEAPAPDAIDNEASADTLTEGDVYEGEGSDEGGYEDGPVSGEPCSSDVSVDVVPKGDCEDPETFTFVVNAEGLDAGVTYTLLLGSDDIVPSEVPFVEEIEADTDGKIVNYTFTEKEGDVSSAPTTGLTFEYILVDGINTEWQQIVFGDDDVELGACETEPVVPAEPTHPATPTTPAPAAAPVVVTHPAATQPAVLANTGTPVTGAALLGMLVVGAGALVATRRRAS